MIGEVRTRETMEHAINFSETGHLCLCTLHANNAYQAMNRVISFFPLEVRPMLLQDLSVSLKAVISQRLIKTVDGGRTPASTARPAMSASSRSSASPRQSVNLLRRLAVERRVVRAVGDVLPAADRAAVKRLPIDGRSVGQAAEDLGPVGVADQRHRDDERVRVVPAQRQRGLGSPGSARHVVSRADEIRARLGAGRHERDHLVACFDQQPRQLARLVGRDPSADSERNFHGEFQINGRFQMEDFRFARANRLAAPGGAQI